MIALAEGGPVRTTDVCGAVHGDQELAHVLYMRHKGWYPVAWITLRCPAEWAADFDQTGTAA